MNTIERDRAIKNRAMCVLFAGFITLPLIGMLFNIGTTTRREVRVTENRVAPPLMAAKYIFLRPTQYFNVVEQRFDDDFGFRKPLLHSYNRLVYLGLGASPTSKVHIGKDGWLYYFGELIYYQDALPYSQQELRTWASILEARRKWLSARGIEYLVVVAPDKSTIYPEHLQPTVVKTIPLRVDQFCGYMRANTMLSVVDMRGELIAAKRSELLYSKSDTHWNDNGALIGADAVDDKLRAWFPSVIAPRRSAFTVQRTPRIFDLARMIGSPASIQEQYLALAPKIPRLARVAPADSPSSNTPEQVTTVDNRNMPSAVIFHDSFMGAMGPFLSEQFRRVDYLSMTNLNQFDGPFVLKHHPNVVIQEVVERTLAEDPPEPKKLKNLIGTQLP